MHKIIFSLCFLFLIFSLDAHALEVSCFREKAEISDLIATPFRVNVSGIDIRGGGIVFFQNGKELPAYQISTENNPSITYTITPDEDSILIRDTDAFTYKEIDPYSLSQGDIIYTIDLGQEYKKGEIRSLLDIMSSGKIRFSLSSDGVNYFDASESAIDGFDKRFIRIIFAKTSTQERPTWIRGILFYRNISQAFIVTPLDASPIQAYRDSSCDDSISLSGLPTQIEYPREVNIVEFQKNPLYRDDTDSDSIENLRDNCPNTSNLDQKDRNFDGVGDACSDDDRDGVYGEKDNCPTLSNTDQTDKNVNNIGDICEFDSDSDGVSDGVDNAIRIKNPDQKDTDYDRIGDVMDNCSLYNPDQLDLDKNGKGDVCDRDLEYRNTNDKDKDGIMDFSDICGATSNPDQSDKDKDGVGDVCDNCAMLQNPDQSDLNKNNIGDACEDTDTDSIEGWRDNCPAISNTDQKDTDNDRVGDACEDTDNDKHYDSIDNCPLQYNPDQKDIDNDKIGDICDGKDNRFLESNKYLFMGLIAFFAFVFIAVIVYLLKKLQ